MIFVMLAITCLVLILDKTGFLLDERTEKLIYIDEELCDIDEAVKQTLDDAYSVNGGEEDK